MRVILSKGVRHSSSNPNFSAIHCRSGWSGSGQLLAVLMSGPTKKAPNWEPFFDLMGDEASSSQDPNCMR